MMQMSRPEGQPEDLTWDVPTILRGEPNPQEYAMLILNAPIVAKLDTVKSLWNSATLRIVVDGGANHWLQFIRSNDAEDLPRPDCAIGDFDSITEQAKAYFKKKGTIFIKAHNQNETDFTKCLRAIKVIVQCEEMTIQYVLALGANGGRVDQIMANMETLHTAKGIMSDTPVIFMTSNSLTWLLKAERNHTILVPEEFVDNRHAVGLIPLCGPTKVTTSGLKWNLEDKTLGFGELVSTSNTFEEGTVEVTSTLDLIWTVEYVKEEI